MAPQQNSTLIDDYLEMSPALLNLPEELGRYSPILAPKCNNFLNNNNNNHKEHNKDNNKKSANYEQAKRQKNYKSNRTVSSRGGRSHRSRSVSLYGVNSTVEQGHKEIPIWLDEEPRYVSGVTNKTTCNDIIKALIDDEISNGNFAYCSRNKDGAASRDYSDYVITESWRGIERSYDGNMAILPVWKAWSRVHNELCLAMKHHSKIKDPLQVAKPQRCLSALYKYLRKLLRFAKNTKNLEKKVVNKTVKKSLTSKEPIPDELLFVILPEKLLDDQTPDEAAIAEKEKNKNLKPTTEESAKQAEAKLIKDKLYRLSETRSSIRKRRTSSRRSSKEKRQQERRRSSAFDPNTCIKRRKDVPNRNSVRNQLARKTSEVDQLYDREYALTKQLTSKCKLYKLQNDLYMDPEKQLELSVGQIQRNIENYADEIVKTEHELHELKNEIKQDISIINNLKRMSLQRKESEAIAVKECEDQMQFVDNIYEFCDNNASMLV